jgi:hypothetical protein
MAIRVTRFSIGEGDAGIQRTVEIVSELIRQEAATPQVRYAAVDVIAGVDPTDLGGQLYALRDWVSDHFVFLRDPSTVNDTVIAPSEQLRIIGEQGRVFADCDCAAALAGALAAAIGMRVSLVTVAFLDTGGAFSHIWASATPPVRFVDGQGRQAWVEFDVTRSAQRIPLEAISRAKVYPVA